MLVLATSGLALPAALKMSGQEDDTMDELNFSRALSVVMMIMYCCYLYFSLCSNRFEFRDDAEEDAVGSVPAGCDGESGNLRRDATQPLRSNAGRRVRYFNGSFDDDDDDDHDNVGHLDDVEKLMHSRSVEGARPASTSVSSCSSSVGSSQRPTLTLGVSLQYLVLITMSLALITDVLMGTIETFTRKYDVNPVFVGAVVVPVFGNAAEHAASVVFAYKNKMDVSIAITIGSSIQISLFVIPSCVLLGWATSRDFTMFFDGFETVSLVLAVVIVSFFLTGGTSNWLIGTLFIGLYVIMAIGFFVHARET